MVEEARREALQEAELVHVDETGWPPHDQALWLWVFVSAIPVLDLIGRRSRVVLQGIIGETPIQWIMSYGYSVYRAYGQRLRCWARTLRKAHGLSEHHGRGRGRAGASGPAGRCPRLARRPWWPGRDAPTRATEGVTP